jgi:hypothetical protein
MLLRSLALFIVSHLSEDLGLLPRFLAIAQEREFG